MTIVTEDLVPSVIELAHTPNSAKFDVSAVGCRLSAVGSVDELKCGEILSLAKMQVH